MFFIFVIETLGKRVVRHPKTPKNTSLSGLHEKLRFLNYRAVKLRQKLMLKTLEKFIFELINGFKGLYKERFKEKPKAFSIKIPSQQTRHSNS